MSPQARWRGQPVLVLALLLGGWVAVRTVLWETPFPQTIQRLPEALLAGVGPGPASVPRAQAKAPAMFYPPALPASGPAPVLLPPVLPAVTPPPAPALPDLPDPLRPRLVPFVPSPPPPPASPQASAPMQQRVVTAHNLLFLSGLSALPIPADLESLFAKPKPASAPYQPLTTFLASPAGGRWSADAWLLLRKDSATALAPAQGSYGSSQAGGMLRFGLAPSSPFRPVAYARVSKALEGTRESELGLGLSARPLPQVPLRVAAEVRVTQLAGETRARPAAFAVTELPPFALPLGLTGEAYAQAGYVGGDFKSAFAEGQVRAERALATGGDARLSAGGGAWGGAQKGAARLDIGPSASLQLKLGETNSRVSMDWRFRVAGDARPASGPALTISAGF